ncbi:hypothetical protein EVAR_62835_1 [Eumeta japonica]|uniref:Uncharacterized protein n=1 Tax=Eumeta variegata TaxID=151549 RepID=A0A4C1ZG58_EUMVA|nr:hypothetical protein EVAR_62835_1 [Eumeta japonica]
METCNPRLVTSVLSAYWAISYHDFFVYSFFIANKRPWIPSATGGPARERPLTTSSTRRRLDVPFEARSVWDSLSKLKTKYMHA